MADAALKEARWALTLAAVAFVPLLVGAANDIHEIDPAQYAEVARQIYLTGDWANLKENGGPFLNKPPVTLWLMALTFVLLGPTSFAVRLPSLVMALLCLWATYRIGARLWDKRTGAVATALLASSLSLQLMVADPKIDMVLTGWMTLAVYLALLTHDRGAFVYGAWLCAGLGMLTKGPIGLCLPVVAILPEALRRRWGARAGEPNGRFWERLRVLRPFTGPIVAAAVMVPWYLKVLADFGSGAAYYLLWDQSFGRLFERSYANDTTPLYFFHTALWAFLPFTGLLAIELTRRAVRLFRQRTLPPDERRVVLWWLVLPFVVISASSFKLPQYLYWLAPPAALLSARLLCRGDLLPPIARALAWFHALLGVGAVAFTALIFGRVFPASGWAATAWLAGVALVCVAGFIWARRLGPALSVAAPALSVLTAVNLFFEGYVHPSLLYFQPDSTYGELARKHDPDGRVLPFVQVGATNASAFYAQRPAREMGTEELAKLVRANEASVAVVDHSQLGALDAAGLRVTPLARRAAYATSRPRREFLDASTRHRVVQNVVFVALAPRDSALTLKGRRGQH